VKLEEITATIILEEEEDDDLLVYCMSEGATDISRTKKQKDTTTVSWEDI
jgi:hypothetical protein